VPHITEAVTKGAARFQNNACVCFVFPGLYHCFGLRLSEVPHLKKVIAKVLVRLLLCFFSSSGGRCWLEV